MLMYLENIKPHRTNHKINEIHFWVFKKSLRWWIPKNDQNSMSQTVQCKPFCRVSKATGGWFSSISHTPGRSVAMGCTGPSKGRKSLRGTVSWGTGPNCTHLCISRVTSQEVLHLTETSQVGHVLLSDGISGNGSSLGFSLFPCSLSPPLTPLSL